VHTAPDVTGLIDVRPVPFDTALQMVPQGEIVDSMAVVVALLAARRRESPRG
jgi:hypothetical protein